MSEEPGRCPCGKYPIYEHCVLVNHVTGKQLKVGNYCVRKFLQLPSGKVFQGISRITEDPTRAANAALIDLAYRKGWINAWQWEFGLDTCRKRILSEKQTAKRVELNQAILLNFKGRV
jgi:hypothetical protein